MQEPLQLGLIRSSRSLFPSSVILVKKSYCSWHFCVDYRAVNNITIKNKFLILVIDELLYELRCSKYFSKLDLCSRYHQIRVKEIDFPKIAFSTHDEHYEFLAMPFGLTNVLPTFLILMNHIFQSYMRKFILIFFDDILVYIKTWYDHLSYLCTALEFLRSNYLYVKHSKFYLETHRLNIRAT